MSANAERTIIIIPCFNEAARLDTPRFAEFLGQCPATDFLFVDDGSTDDTRAVLEKFCDGDRASFVVHEKNQGKGESVRTGVGVALERKSSFVGYWDADLAIPLSTILDFLEIMRRRPAIELVIGSRVRLLGRTIRRNAVRHYVGRVFATAVSLITQLPVYDTQCGAKMFRVNDRTAELFRDPFVSRWIFDVELLMRLMQRTGMTGASIPVYEFTLDHWSDVPGSKLKGADFVRAVPDLVRIVRRYGIGGARGRRDG